MRTYKQKRIPDFYFLVACLGMIIFLFSACEKNIDISVNANQPMLVVEGYINNEMPEMNYVVLSRSVDFYHPDFQSLAVAGAKVTITEGALVGDSYNWNQSKKVQLFELPSNARLNARRAPTEFRQGVYFDPRIISDSANALRGSIGKHYLLEITTEGDYYSAIASLLPAVSIDSLTCGYGFIDSDDNNLEKSRVTIHYQDPDTLGNAQLFYWQNWGNRVNVGWGGMGTAWRNSGVDDLTNGQYMRVTQNRSFEIGDTVTYHMASVTRDVFDFWESFRDARNNSGALSTPVRLLNKINGKHVTGCFSGLSLSSKTVVMYK